MIHPEPQFVRHIRYYDKTYRVDIYGYLLDPEEWTKRFARRNATEMGMGSLKSEEWDILNHLRQRFSETGKIPAIPETCQTVGISRERVEDLFPLGYYRCAVKLAGLNPVNRAFPT